MTFKLENIQIEGIDSSQEIIGKYDFNGNKSLSGDRTFWNPFRCVCEDVCSEDYCPCNYDPHCSCELD